MAAVVLKDGEDFDCSETCRQVVNYLPSYARPRFIRVQVRKFLLPPGKRRNDPDVCPRQPCLEMTGTFKMKKVRLVEEGFDPDQVADPLYFLDAEKETYVPLTREIYGAILSGQVKL